MITIENHKTTTFGGKIVMRRQFFNAQTDQYLCIEAHEDKKGKFHVAFWVNEGNDGDHGLGGAGIRKTLARMENHPVPAGMIEMSIPADKWE